MKDTGYSVRERILRSAEKLFAAKGYEGTTTREIVRDAGTSLSAIQSHFKSKEKIYEEVLRRTNESCNAMPGSVFAQIEVARSQGFLNKESIWDYIVQLISAITEWTFLPENAYKSVLMNNELLHPTEFYPQVHEPVTALFNYLEVLLTAYTETEDSFWAKEVSYLIVTSLFDIRNYPRMLQGVLNADINEESISARVKQQLKEYTFFSLRAYLDMKAEKR